MMKVEPAKKADINGLKAYANVTGVKCEYSIVVLQ